MTNLKDAVKLRPKEMKANIPGANGERFHIGLIRGDLQVELYIPQHEYLQQPHTRDECYVVTKGSGQFQMGEDVTSFEAGDFLFVPAGMEHRFFDFGESVETWVIFFGPEGGAKIDGEQCVSDNYLEELKMKEIMEIYAQTRIKFKEWSQSPLIDIRNAACPETLRINTGPSKIGDKMGFSILWTPPKMKPDILFCGCCVTSFGDYEANLLNLSGEIPKKNTCMNAQHNFGQTIESVFKDENRMDLFETCVGMNMWHFQYVGSPASNQYNQLVREFCEENTIKIIQLLEPKLIITLHNHTSKLKKKFPNLIQLMHPSFQGGKSFTEEMKKIIRQKF